MHLFISLGKRYKKTMFMTLKKYYFSYFLLVNDDIINLQI
jgi:hypothetical protein